MRRFRLRSLQSRLIARLTVLYILAAVSIFAVLAYRAYQTAGTLNNRELSLRAADLARAVHLSPGGSPRLELPSELQAAYAATPDSNLFAVRDASNNIIAALPPSFGDLVRRWPTPSDDPDFFHLEDFGAASRDYDGLNIGLQSEAGTVSISVANAAGADALVRSVIRDFVLDIAWTVPLLVVTTIVVATFVIRGVLKPVDQLAQIAKTIGPAATDVRLSEERLPTEMAPLVEAINRALERLEQGFAVQRQFTANAAHELRTPLAIITAALDEQSQDSADLVKLKGDVARMNRLVEQLLRVARLDAIALDVSPMVDLNAVAFDIVESMAPWAIAQQRQLAFQAAPQPVKAEGNAHAIGDAIRNLVENGVIHTLPRTEVVVCVRTDGRIEVRDRGPGVSPEDRWKIFQRFWRGRNPGAGGAGLGLAIVQEIMTAHRGEVRVETAPSGGAIFTLRFPIADERRRRRDI